MEKNEWILRNLWTISKGNIPVCATEFTEAERKMGQQRIFEIKTIGEVWRK